jgi:pimeloyl-ACP methyl ester carboxylesterase
MGNSDNALGSGRRLLQVAGSLLTAAGAVTFCTTNGSAAGSERKTSPTTIPIGNRSLSGRWVEASGQSPRGIVLAIHGGGYTSKYFDVPGQSAMEFASSLGYHVVAVDRPGYGATTDWLLGFDDQTKVLTEVGDWTRRRFDTAQGRVFLYGHSIGGMLSLLIANADPSGYSGSMTGSGAVYHERALTEGGRPRASGSPAPCCST